MSAITKAEYEEWLNEIDVPSEDLKSEGGRIPDGAKLGTWMRRNDPVAFNVGFQERQREEQFRADQVKGGRKA